MATTQDTAAAPRLRALSLTIGLMQSAQPPEKAGLPYRCLRMRHQRQGSSGAIAGQEEYLAGHRASPPSWSGGAPAAPDPTVAPTVL